MQSLIVTNTHNNRGAVLDMQFTDHSKLYSDGTDKLYTMFDFVDVEAIDHEQMKADKMIEYWTMVSMTICEFKKKEAPHE